VNAEKTANVLDRKVQREARIGLGIAAILAIPFVLVIIAVIVFGIMMTLQINS
jgi:hypothetical protein